MSIFQQLESMMSSMKTEEWEMDPRENKYQITFNGAPCCVVDFVNQKTEESDDFEIAQEEPGIYIVYLTNVKDKVKSDEYQAKLKKMGFNKISVYEDAEPEVDSVPEDTTLNKRELEVLEHVYTEEYIKIKDIDKSIIGIILKLEHLGYIEKRGVTRSERPNWYTVTIKGEKFVQSQHPEWYENLKQTVPETQVYGEPGKEGSLDDEDTFKCTKCKFTGKYIDVSKGRGVAPKCPKCGAAMFNDEPYEESENIEEEQINESSNEEVIDLFVNDNFPHDKEEASKMGIKRWMSVWGSDNLKISKQNNGWALVNYNTPILFRDSEGKIYFNTDKYSVTTSKIQNQIRKSLSGKEFKEVDEKTITEKIQ